MQKKLTNCNPTICGKTDLMSEDGIYINSVKEQCKCINANTCQRIIDLLLAKKIWEAEKLITTM